jgi:hypothetical protein
MKKLGLALVMLATAASAAFADAPGDAWAVAKNNLPADAMVVAGFDLTAIKKLAIFPKALGMIHADEGLQMIKAGCGLDPIDSILGGVVVVMPPTPPPPPGGPAVDQRTKGAVFLSTKIDLDKAVSCLNKMAQQDKKTVTATKPDANGIVELTASGENQHVYLAFRKNVMVITFDPTDKAMLVGFLSGKGTQLAWLSKVNTSATVWGGLNKTEQVDAGMTMKALYGAVDVKGGMLNVDAHVLLGSTKEATDAVAKYNAALKNGENKPEVAALFKGFKVSTSGAEVTATGSFAEKDLEPLLKLLK